MRDLFPTRRDATRQGTTLRCASVFNWLRQARHSLVSSICVMPHYDDTFLEHCSRIERQSRRSFRPIMSAPKPSSAKLPEDSQIAEDPRPSSTRSWSPGQLYPNSQPSGQRRGQRRRPFAPLKWFRTTSQSAQPQQNHKQPHHNTDGVPQLVHHQWSHGIMTTRTRGRISFSVLYMFN